MEIEKSYTEKQIKEAFWETFHKSGELWFPYDTEENAQDITEGCFSEFMSYLEKDKEPNANPNSPDNLKETERK